MLNFKTIGQILKKALISVFIYLFLASWLVILISYSPIVNIKFFQTKIGLNFLLLIPTLISFIILIIINRDLYKGKFTDFKKNYKKYIPIIIKYYICGLIVMNIADLIVSLFRAGLPINEINNRKTMKLYPYFAIFSATINAPICEEICFRGNLKKLFKNEYLFAIVTGFIFGFMHVLAGDYINIFSYAGLGFFLGMIYFETDNILSSTIAHVFHNTLCIFLIFLKGGI